MENLEFNGQNLEKYVEIYLSKFHDSENELDIQRNKIDNFKNILHESLVLRSAVDKLNTQIKLVDTKLSATHDLKKQIDKNQKELQLQQIQLNRICNELDQLSFLIHFSKLVSSIQNGITQLLENGKLVNSSLITGLIDLFKNLKELKIKLVSYKGNQYFDEDIYQQLRDKIYQLLHSLNKILVDVWNENITIKEHKTIQDQLEIVILQLPPFCLCGDVWIKPCTFLLDCLHQIYLLLNLEETVNDVDNCLNREEPLRSFYKKLWKFLYEPLLKFYADRLDRCKHGDITFSEISISAAVNSTSLDQNIQKKTLELRFHEESSESCDGDKETPPKYSFNNLCNDMCDHLNRIEIFLTFNFDLDASKTDKIFGLNQLIGAERPKTCLEYGGIYGQLNRAISEKIFEPNIPENIEGYTDFREGLSYLVRNLRGVALTADLEGVGDISKIYFSKFLRNFSAAILAKARIIISKSGDCATYLKTISSKDISIANDTSVTIDAVGQNYSKTDLETPKSIAESLEKFQTLFQELNVEKYLGCDSLDFPECQISEIMKELLAEIRQVSFLGHDESIIRAFDEDEDSDVKSFPQFCSTVDKTIRDIVELFINLTPAINSNPQISQIPLYSIVYMNDCLFLAHQLIRLDAHTRNLRAGLVKVNNIPDKNRSEDDLHDIEPLLHAYAYELMAKGVGTFKVQLFANQFKIIKDFVVEYFDGLNTDKNLDAIPSDKPLKKCCLHLKNLKKLFAGHLPRGIWQKSLGSLLDHELNTIMAKVLEMDDISVKCSESMLNHFGVCVIDDAISLFDSTADFAYKDSPLSENSFSNPQIYSRSLAKFKGLLQILEKPMSEIAESWLRRETPDSIAKFTNGIPLFTAIELRRLIRALFQNTEHRKSILGKIK
ncbi:unnamed protein product [Gordionus sp. m RMFG-2023]|uniref:uncharacterized protein LOC135931646 n=1 Tax=Gordionus sp. m RMFG-2023 TaxID=3053472 RepID=UPI0030E49DD2